MIIEILDRCRAGSEEVSAMSAIEKDIEVYLRLKLAGAPPEFVDDVVARRVYYMNEFERTNNFIAWLREKGKQWPEPPKAK